MNRLFTSLVQVGLATSCVFLVRAMWPDFKQDIKDSFKR